MSQHEPVRSEELATIQRIGSRLRNQISQQRERHRRRRTVATISLSVLVGASLTGGAVALIASQEERGYSAYCYSGSTTDSAFTQATIPEPIDKATGEGSQREAADILELCSAMWSSGVIGQEKSPDDPNAHLYPVPELQLCVRDDGVSAVFPSREAGICEELGLRKTESR